MEIGQKLKEKRTCLELSQEQLAEKLGVTRQTIANWERSKTYPDIASVLKLSDLYGVSLDELLKEDADMRTHVEDTAALPRRSAGGRTVHSLPHPVGRRRVPVLPEIRVT